MINLDVVKKARELLSPEIQNNLELSETTEYNLLCEGAGALDIVIQKLEKTKKREK